MLQEHMALPSLRTAHATDGKKAPALVPHRYISGVEHSHRGQVQAVQWLPGMNITKEGAHPPTVREPLSSKFPCLSPIACALWGSSEDNC